MPTPARPQPKSDPEARLAQLGLRLPTPPKAMATYASAVASGGFLFVAGQGPLLDGELKIEGKVGGTVTLEQAYDAARISCLNALAVAKQALGSLTRIRRVVRATIYVACRDDFTQQPKVANGATDLLRELFGDAGLPARAAVGVNVLPMDIPVEVELQFEI